MGYPVRFRTKHGGCTEFFSNFITKIPFYSHFSTELYKVFTQFRFVAKSNLRSRTLISVLVNNLWLRLKTVSKQKVPFKRPLCVMVTPPLDIPFLLMFLELIETLKSMPETDWILTFLSIKVSTDISVCSRVELTIGKFWSKQSISWLLLLKFSAGVSSYARTE